MDEKQTFDEQLSNSLYVDCMLGSLARHLRFYGFDVFYKIGSTHREMELEASILNVPLITTAKEHCYVNCWQLPDNLRGSIIDQLNYLFTYHKLGKKLAINHTRCGLCNTLLKEVADVDKIRQVLPQKTLDYYLIHSSETYPNSTKKFLVWYCKTCDKYYWHGSHWQNILKKVEPWIEQ